MRYEKKVIVLSSSLAVLLLAWGAGMIFSPERVAARAESAKLIAGKSADIAAISIKNGAVAIELAKSGSSWAIVDGAAKLPAQSTRVSSFLDDLAAISRLRVVAKSKESWAGFQLDDAKAKRATLKNAAGKVVADIYLGGYGPTGSEVYLRKGGSDSSYLVETGLNSYLNASRSSWLDLRVLGGLKETDLQSIALKSSIALDGKGKAPLKLDYSLRRDGKAWKSGAAAIDAEAVSALLRSVIGLQGEDYVTSPPPEAFAAIQARVGLELGNGMSQAIEVGALEGNERFYARVSGGASAAASPVFTVSAYNLRSILKSQADLAAKK
jgi:hypothetical protein